MDINKHDWEVPEIWIEDEGFMITIKKDVIEIEYEWDHGYGGRGTGRMIIDTNTFNKLIKEMLI